MKTTSKTKPRKCPSCGGVKIATIVYGLQAGTPDFLKKLDAGKVVIGGCVLYGNDPQWQCIQCGMKIYKKNTDSTF